VSRILVRSMKLENKINAELLHHPLKQYSYCLNKPRYNFYPIDHDLRIVKRYFLKLKIVFYILEGECKFLLQSVHHTLCFCRESVQQRVFWEQQMFCTFCFCYVHLPLETLFIVLLENFSFTWDCDFVEFSEQSLPRFPQSG